MKTFDYTHMLSPESEAVHAAYYNSETKELTIDYRGGVVYTYDNFPKWRWDGMAIAEAHSVSIGREWVPFIKKNFGPGKWQGRRNHVTFNDATKVTNINGAGGILTGLLSSAGTVGTAKDLKVTPKTVVTDNTKHSMKAAPAVPAQTSGTRYKVTFKVKGGSKAKHEVRATSIDDAVEQVVVLLQGLGLKFSVKSVTRYFD